MYDVAIVGGGPAGASAATFTARAGLQTVLIDADAGMTRRAMVNNHLGFPEGVTGPDLVDNGKLMAARAGAKVVAGKVVDLQAQILSAQSSAHDAQSEEFELKRKLDEFEKEISDLNGWTEQDSANELKALAALFRQ